MLPKESCSRHRTVRTTKGRPHVVTDQRDEPNLPDWFVVREARPGEPERDAAVALLDTNGGAEAQGGVSDGARVFVAWDPAAPPEEAIVAVAIVASRFGAVAELGPVAVSPSFLGQHLTQRLLAPVTDVLRGEGVRRLGAAVGPDDPRLTRTLEGVGFRPTFWGDRTRKIWHELEL